MSASSMDLSKFKKLRSDEHTTTFQHKDGHELKIAHSRISPKLKADLDKIPMASGGPVPRPSPDSPKINQKDAEDFSKGAQSGPTSFSDAVANIKSGLGFASGGKVHRYAEGTPSAGGFDYGGTQQQPVDPAIQQPQSIIPPDPKLITQPVDSEPEEEVVPVVKKNKPHQGSPDGEDSGTQVEDPVTPQISPEDYASAVSQHLQNVDQNTSNDLMNGHITPETYHDLFAKKDTLGKIGTIFGLMLGGAGAGLAHQQNNLLGMMDKQIQNDMDAQKTSATNLQNAYRLHQQNELNQSQVRSNDAATHVVLDAQNQIEKNRFALDSLVKKTEALPQGSPQRNAANATLAAIIPEFTTKNANLAGIAGTRAAALNYAQPPSGGSGPVDYGKMNRLEATSKMGIPGLPDQSDIGNMTSESAKVETTEALRDSYKNSFNELSKMVLAGKLSPKQRAAYVEELGQKIAHTTGSSEDAAQKEVDAMLPSAGDVGQKTRDVKLSQGNRFFDNMRSGTPTLNRFHVSNQSQSSSNSQQQYKKDTDGRPYVTKNGKNYYVK